MAISTKIIILVFALLALYCLARQMGLGRGTPIQDADHARQIANNDLIGFNGSDAVVDSGGQTALVRGGADNYAFIRKHGAHFIVRQISGTEIVSCDNNQLLLRHPDLPKGAIILDFGHIPELWATQFAPVQSVDRLTSI